MGPHARWGHVRALSVATEKGLMVSVGDNPKTSTFNIYRLLGPWRAELFLLPQPIFPFYPDCQPGQQPGRPVRHGAARLHTGPRAQDQQTAIETLFSLSRVALHTGPPQEQGYWTHVAFVFAPGITRLQ